MSEARLILLCGLPGSGKTTLAKQLASELPAVRLCPDEWLHDLGLDYQDPPARERVEKRLWRLGQELLKLDQSVILENGFWGRDQRDEIREGARALGVAVELRYLDVPTEELWQRLEARNAEPVPGTVPVKREDFDKWVEWLQVPDAAELALFDN